MEKQEKTREALMAERKRYKELQQKIRIGAIAVAIVLSLISLCVSCSTNRAVKKLTEEMAAQAAITAAQQQEDSQPQENSQQETAAVPDANAVTLSFVGNVTIGNRDGEDYKDSFEEAYASQGAAYFFQNVKSLLEGDDLTVANLECALTTTDSREDREITYQADPSLMNVLTEGSVEVVGCVNDHVSDYGDEGFVDTLANADKMGLLRFSDSDDYMSIATVHGVKVGFTGCNEADGAEYCREQMALNMKNLKAEGAQIVVCMIHWVDSGEEVPLAAQAALAHAMVDNGADAVVGVCDGRIQGIELYQGKYICYSLGNFCIGGSNPEDKASFIFRLTFPVEDGAPRGETTAQIFPCCISSSREINTYCPVPLEAEEKTAILDRIFDLSDRINGGITRNDITE